MGFVSCTELSRYKSMSKFGDELLERVELAVDRTIQMVLALPNNMAGWEVGKQIIRSSGSVGANLEESRGTISKKRFYPQAEYFSSRK